MVTIGIVTAENDEVRDICASLRDVVTETHLSRSFHHGLLNGVNVIVVRSRIGKVACAATTAVLVDRYAPDAVVFVGVAGALKAPLTIGDVVVAHAAVQHDVDVRPFRKVCEVPEVNSVDGQIEICSARSDLADALAEALRGALANTVDLAADGIDAEALARHKVTAPTVHRGVIATGDQFISSDEMRAGVRERVPDAHCVEMEGAALAQVCAEAGVPFVICRAMSDSAEGGAADDFMGFMRDVAAPYCRLIARVATEVVAKMVTKQE